MAQIRAMFNDEFVLRNTYVCLMEKFLFERIGKVSFMHMILYIIHCFILEGKYTDHYDTILEALHFIEDKDVLCKEYAKFLEYRILLPIYSSKHIQSDTQFINYLGTLVGESGVSNLISILDDTKKSDEFSKSLSGILCPKIL